jgi:hypothetical protein
MIGIFQTAAVQVYAQRVSTLYFLFVIFTSPKVCVFTGKV